MSKFYDADKDRLVMLSSRSDSGFWDEQWKKYDLQQMMRSGLRNKFIKRHTSRFLSPRAKILEGGCGLGQNVYALASWGFDAYGVDFAQYTVDKVKSEFPNLKLGVQDVRKLDFSDNFFDGYWSLGVIEHFYNGYEGIIREAQRVIRPGGYLFITFPYISPLRRMKIRKNAYPLYKSGNEPRNFYQFILNSKIVARSIEREGFKLVFNRPWDATNGLRQEVPSLEGLFSKIYASQNFLARGVRLATSILLERFTSHVILLVFRKV